MAEYLRLNLTAWAVLFLVTAALSSSVFKRDVLEVDEPQQLDPVQEAELNEDLIGGDDGTRGDRDKRFVKFAVVKKIGLKAVLLNFIFGKIDSFIDAKTRAINQLDKINVAKNSYYGINPPKSPQNNLQQSTPAPVEFQTNSPVSLVIPDRLYGNSFSLITNISNIIGDVLFNTADRAQELADRVNEKLRTKFGFKTKVFSIDTGSGSSSSSSSNSYRYNGRKNRPLRQTREVDRQAIRSGKGQVWNRTRGSEDRCRRGCHVHVRDSERSGGAGNLASKAAALVAEVSDQTRSMPFGFPRICVTGSPPTNPGN